MVMIMSWSANYARQNLQLISACFITIFLHEKSQYIEGSAASDSYQADNSNDSYHEDNSDDSYHENSSNDSYY